MSIQYVKAPSFTASTVITADNQIQLAEAFNSRLKNGLADPTRRLHQYIFNNFRSPRNPADFVEGTTPNYPSAGEFTQFYSYLNYDDVSATWPSEDPGTYEGANQATPSNQFVHGLTEYGAPYSGDGNAFTSWNLTTPDISSTPAEMWQAAKVQRGSLDIETGDIYAPAFEVGQAHYKIVTPSWSHHGKTAGGVLPQPEVSEIQPECREDISETDYYYYDNILYKFTNIDTDEVVTYTGICGPEKGGSDTDVYYVYEGPFAWYVIQFNGDITRYDKSSWIQGPYTGGGKLSWQDGKQVDRLMVSPFVSEFNGSDFQLSILGNCYQMGTVSFDYQAFFTSQYQLSPSYGISDGETIADFYPSWHYVGGSDNVVDAQTGVTASIPSYFSIGGFCITHTGCTGSVSISQIDDGVTTGTWTIDTDTTSSFVYIWSNNTASVTTRYKINNAFSCSGYFNIEQSWLYTYKPQVHDLYAVLRLGSAFDIDSDETMDQRGMNFSFSKEIYDYYAGYGCIVNQSANTNGVYQQEQAVNTNPVYDASRRWINSITRVINSHDLQLTTRPLVVGYAVEGGKSILYVKRYHSGLGLTSLNMDMFNGIVDPSTGSVNGIVTTASMSGYTNEWLMFMCTKPYHTSDTSIWKPNLYTWYMPYINRCLFIPTYREVLENQDAFGVFQDVNPAFGASALYRNYLMYPEAMTAYNYYGQSGLRFNTHNCADGDTACKELVSNFYKSCQVYPKDYEIESATFTREGAEDVVRLQFTTRFQHCDEAPASIARDTATWNLTDLINEPYRTDENAIRQFILRDTIAAGWKYGDNSLSSPVQTWSDNPFGSVYPTLFFTKLVPRPYSPLSGSTCCYDGTGSLVESSHFRYMELLLKSICEGYIDDTTSISYGCLDGRSSIYDYTYENLVYDATGNRSSISNFPESVRSDKPYSYGPLPYTSIYADTLNQLSQCVNKLNKVRLILPWRMEIQQVTYTSPVSYVSGDDIHYPFNYGYLGYCTTGTPSRAAGIKLEATCPDAETVVTTGEWLPATEFTAETKTEWKNDGGIVWYCSDDSTTFGVNTLRTKYNFRFNTLDDCYSNAVNSDIISLLTGSTDSIGFFAELTSTETAIGCEVVPNGEGSSLGIENDFWRYDESNVWKINSYSNVSSTCVFLTNGSFDAGESYCSGSLVFGRAMLPWTPRGMIEAAYGPAKTINVAVKNSKDLMLVVPEV